MSLDKSTVLMKKDQKSLEIFKKTIDKFRHPCYTWLRKFGLPNFNTRKFDTKFCHYFFDKQVWISKSEKEKRKMKRIDIDKNIKAKSIEEAAKKFAKALTAKGYEWAAEEIIETVENGYFCCSNASEHSLIEGKVTSPRTNDWTYYWAIENIDGNEWYAWFIEKGYNNVF